MQPYNKSGVLKFKLLIIYFYKGETMKKILLLLIMLIMLSSAVFSQDKKIETLNVNDAEETEKKIEKDNPDDSTYYNDFIEMRFHLGFDMPTIELQYILTTTEFKYENINSSFKDIRGIELKLGNTDILSIGKGISEYDFDYLYINNIAESYGELDADQQGGVVEAWNVGLGNQDGYAYELGNNSHIILYHGSGLNWSSLDFVSTDNIGPNDYNVFGDAVRFGDMFDTGIKIKYGAFAINAGYQRITIFPRHQFWYWALSEIIEHGSEGLLDNFVIKIFRSTPEALPIVNAVLKAGLSYAVSELRADDMHWPVNSVGPLMFDNIKLGMTFTL